MKSAFKASSGRIEREPFRLLVCGSRTFADRELLFRRLDELTKKIKRTVIVVHGGAKGADRMAGDWAWTRGLTQEVHHADWSKGKNAGFARNSKMIEVADAVVAFWDGISEGTKDTLTKAKKAGLPVRVIRFEPIKETKGVQKK